MKKRIILKLRIIECPSCGGQLNMDKGNNKYIYCPYCGNQLEVDNNETIITKNINIHKRYTDDARIEEAYMRDRENERLEI